MIEISEHEHDRDINVPRGETILIHLSENPTTGYRWQMVSDGKPVCELVDDSFDAGKGVGQGGKRHWRFRAAQVGTCEIALAYRRGWETADKSARTFALKVRVEK